MANHYIYLISSLPMLHFGAKPPFSFEKFLRACRDLIPDGDLDILKNISLSGAYVSRGAGSATLERWRLFDTALRNELVKIRASRKRIDPSKYIRQDGYAETAITHIAMNAYRNPSIIEGERILDAARWEALDEMAFGHYFDIDHLITYAYKLLILEKWDRTNSANKAAMLEAVLVKA